MARSKSDEGKLNHIQGNGGQVVGTPYAEEGWDKPQHEHEQVVAQKRGNGRKTKSWSEEEGRAAKDAEHLAALESKAPAGSARINISLPKLDIREIELTLEGDSPLICHKWSEKAKRLILDKQMGKASEGREHKNPEEDYRESLYRLPDGSGYGFPAIAFKNAAVTACTSLGKSITKVAARQAFHVVGELVRIEGEPRPREDMVRVGMGTADIRYRGEFPEWRVRLRVRYNARVLSDEQVVNLFNVAGFAVGVGEWRSERDGSYGLFHVA
jgi:hypothetical protein